MIIFVKLLLAHLLGDFLLQPSAWVADKQARKHRSRYLWMHTALHGILAGVLVFHTDFIGYAVVLAVLHGTIDVMKLRYQTQRTQRAWFITDQILHVIVLAVITSLYTGNTSLQMPDDRFWIVLTGILYLTKPVSMIIRNVISIWTPESKNGDESSLANAGNYIGILERLFVFGFIVTGHFDAIGFLLAAKSIFRFGDLMEARERKLTEYVLIGTLLSFGIAILTGMLVAYGLAML